MNLVQGLHGNGTRYQRKAYWSQAIIFFAVVIFFCGLRSGIADTGTYIQMFKGYPSSISGMDLKSVNKDKGFFVISVLFKQFISNDFHGWLFLITLISGVCIDDWLNALFGILWIKLLFIDRKYYVYLFC